MPLLPWKNTPAPTLHEHLQKIPSWASLQDEFVHKGKASELYKPYKYLLLVEKKTHRQFSNKIGRGTVANYLSKNGLLKGCIRWLRKHHKKDTFSNTGKKSKTHIQTFKHVKRKLAKGKGFWDVSIKFMGKAFTGVIKKTIKYAVHPSLDRFFSIRELMHIMGMPHDFQLENLKNINHICQNVPVMTAKDYADEVVKFCQGRSQMTQYVFMRQNNMSRRNTGMETKINTEPIKLINNVKKQMKINAFKYTILDLMQNPKCPYPGDFIRLFGITYEMLDNISVPKNLKLVTLNLFHFFTINFDTRVIGAASAEVWL